MNAVERFHEKYVRQRRVRSLAAAIAPHIPARATVLDVGCGDGALAEEILRHRADVSIVGLEVAARPGARIPVRLFNGMELPVENRSFDVVLFVDVLHHTHHADHLLREARRVARSAIVIKDHCADGFLARPTLRFMDRVGNARFGVALPHLYLRWAEWSELFRRVNLALVSVERRPGLYPAPLSWLFDRSLHFVAQLQGAAR